MSETNSFHYLYTKQLWEQFTQGQTISDQALPDYVYNSWMRCRKKGYNPCNIPAPTLLSPSAFEKHRKRYADLLEIATPVLHMIRLTTAETQPIAILTSEEGVILEIASDESPTTIQETFYNTPGVKFDEDFVGMRATILALIEKKPIALRGSEHYFEVFHQSLCYAAPIFDQDGNAIASISIATSLKKYHPHTMAMLTAASDNISAQLQKLAVDKEKNILSSLIYSICNSLPEGIIALNTSNEIIYANAAAEDFLVAKREDIVGHPIWEFVDKSCKNELEKTISTQKTKNISLHLRGQSLENKFLCRVQPIKREGDSSVGILLSLASDKQVLKGLTQVSGNKAYYSFDDILGNSAQIQRCVKFAKKIAKKSSRVLITGESGTGKELFAQAIHNASPHSSGPFVAISCASMPRELVEAELFGYVAGAFTGANKGGSVGKFELAQNGTLFLDEINSLPMEAQGKLLRALQENEVLRVGGSTPIPVNANVITATNVDLMEMVKAKTFRKDLLYRINSVEIYIPPLRERLEDIACYVEHFIKMYGQDQKTKYTFSPGWFDALLHHRWSGNVRELENACEYSLIVCDGETLLKEHLPPAIAGKSTPRTKKDVPVAECDNVEAAYEKWLTNALRINNGNISRTAKKLGISRNTLYRKLKEFGLDSKNFKRVGN